MRSSRQSSEELIEVFRGLIQRHEISLNIDIYPSHFINPIALDVEHDEQGGFVGIGIWANNQAWYYTKVTDLLKELLKDSQIVAHNGRSDFDCLRQWGIDVTDTQLYWDTQLIAHIIDSSRGKYGLKKLAELDLGITYPSYEDIVGKHKTDCLEDENCTCTRITLNKQPVELVTQYNSLDCVVTWRLYEKQKTSIIRKTI